LRRVRARAYPALGPTGTREDFDLMSLDRDGRPADSPGSGKWFCARYFERDCAHWVSLKGRRKNMGRCREFFDAHAGPARAVVREMQQACGALVLAAKAQAQLVSTMEKRGAGGPKTESSNPKS
jgi:hypothetical protein